MARQKNISLRLAFLLTVLAGCAGSRTDLLCEDQVCVECSHPDHVRIQCVHVWQEEDGVLVYGHVHRCSQCKRRLCGCVHVQILSADDRVLCESECKCVPGHRSRHCPSCCTFRLSVPITPPADARFHIAYRPA